MAKAFRVVVPQLTGGVGSVADLLIDQLRVPGSPDAEGVTADLLATIWRAAPRWC
jgi:hypothetical protein